MDLMGLVLVDVENMELVLDLVLVSFGFGLVWFGFGFGLVWFGFSLVWFGFSLVWFWFLLWVDDFGWFESSKKKPCKLGLVVEVALACRLEPVKKVALACRLEPVKKLALSASRFRFLTDKLSMLIAVAS